MSPCFIVYGKSLIFFSLTECTYNKITIVFVRIQEIGLHQCCAFILRAWCVVLSHTHKLNSAPVCYVSRPCQNRQIQWAAQPYAAPPLVRRNDSRKMRERREEEYIMPLTSWPETSDTARSQELQKIKNLNCKKRGKRGLQNQEKVKCPQPQHETKWIVLTFLNFPPYMV